MTGAGDRPEEFRPPTALESAVRALGADTIRYRADYIMLPMRDGIRLATVVFRPRDEGRYPALLVRSPYPAAIPDQFKPVHTAQFKKNYVLVMQNERGSEWPEGDFGFLTATTADGQDTLDWISAREWSNGKVGLAGCSSTAENQLKLGAEQAEQAEQGHQREVARVIRLPGRCEQGLELQVGEPQGG